MEIDVFFLCPACATRNARMVRLLVRNGADVNQKCLDGWTALHEAVSQNQVEICEVLVEHGAEISSRNIYGVTPLFLAAQCGCLEPLRFLIRNGWYTVIPLQSGVFPVHHSAGEF